MAQCIELLSHYTQFDNDTINDIKSHLNSEVYDIDVYMTTAYARGLCKLAEASVEPLDEIHLDNLCSFEIIESLKLGERDYAHEINENILKMLKHEAGKKQQLFGVGIFSNLLDKILFLNEDHVKDALSILALYTTNGRQIPWSTVAVLENK